MWFEGVIKAGCEGKVYLCRYADDFVCLFQYKPEADRFYAQLCQRLSKFNLSLAAEKTRIISFTKWRMQEGNRFDFLGFEFRWGVDRKGKAHVVRRTCRNKLKKALANFTRWCKENRNLRLRKLFDILKAKLRGYYNYYGIIGNYRSLHEFWRQAQEILFKWLNRRSQRQSYNKRGFYALLKHVEIPQPRITEKSRQLAPGNSL